MDYIQTSLVRETFSLTMGSELKMKFQAIFLAAFGIFAFQSAWAQHIAVTQAWVRPTVPGQAVAAAYMDITAGEEAARLIAVRSAISPRVQIHSMQMDGDIMRMRQVPGLDLPKNTVVSLKPGGYHLMLTKLKQPIKAGDKILLTLIVETRGKRETVSVEAIARINAPDEASHEHDHLHH